MAIHHAVSLRERPAYLTRRGKEKGRVREGAGGHDVG